MASLIRKSSIPFALGAFGGLVTAFVILLSLSLGPLTPVIVLGFTMAWVRITQGLPEMCSLYQPRRK